MVAGPGQECRISVFWAMGFREGLGFRALGKVWGLGFYTRIERP